MEKFFADSQVYKILLNLTRLKLDLGKIYNEQLVKTQERSHFALMTDKMFNKMLRKMEQRSFNLLQPVPFKEPRQKEPQILDTDSEIENFDTAKYVFTDVSYNTTEQNRIVVVREPNGNLRTACPEEHDRMNRIFFEKPDRPVSEPAIFSTPHLEKALERDLHRFVLDWACHFFEPDDPRFIEISSKVYDWTLRNDKIINLHSTRHFASFIFLHGDEL